MNVVNLYTTQLVGDMEEHTLKILIVEDHTASKFILEDLLMDAKFKYDTASNGTIALHLLKENKYDVVLMDILLPDINGIDVVKSFRTFDSETYVIAITAYASQDMKQICLSSGFNDFMSKPFGIDNLLRKLKNINKSTTQ